MIANEDYSVSKPNVFSVNKSLSRGDIDKLGTLRVLGNTMRYLPDVTVDGNTILCQGLVGVRETTATTSGKISILGTPSSIKREGMTTEIKLITCRLGVMFVVVNHCLDFFYFAADSYLTKDAPYFKFKDDLKYENFKSIKDAMEAYSVYELVEEI